MLDNYQHVDTWIWFDDNNIFRKTVSMYANINADNLFLEVWCNCWQQSRDARDEDLETAGGYVPLTWGHWHLTLLGYLAIKEIILYLAIQTLTI